MTRFYNALAIIAVVLTPVAMMATLGYTVYAEVLQMTGLVWLALVSGGATAAALEAVGVVAGETALWFHARRDRRWWTAAAILALYVLAGLAMLRGTPLIFLPALAGSVYVLVGLRSQAQRETAAGEQLAAEQRQDERAIQAEARDWRREQWRIKQADDTRLRELELAQSQHTAPGAGSGAGVELAAVALSGHVCEDCGQSFGSVQAINAHRRFCRGVVSQNGTVH